MIKYYLELRSVKRNNFIERMYFDSYEELLNYLVKNGVNIFNWGFDRKMILISEIQKGKDEDQEVNNEILFKIKKKKNGC